MKVKSKKCKQCNTDFFPYNSLQKCCGIKCDTKYSKEKEKTRKTKIKEKKKESISVLEKVADAIFSKFIRNRDAIKTTGGNEELICFTCDKRLPIKEAHNMHFISRKYKKYRFSEDNCRGGCMHCNVMLHGNYIEYFQRLEKDIGREKIDEMIQGSKDIYKQTKEELQYIIDKYK